MGQLYDTRRALQAALVGVKDAANSSILIATNRAILGYQSRVGNLSSVARDVIAFATSNSNSSGALAFVGPTRSVSLDEMGYGPAVVDVAVFFFKDKGRDQNWADVDNFTEAVLNSFRSSNYAAYNSVVPYRMTMDAQHWAIEDTQGIVVQTYSVEFPDPA